MIPANNQFDVSPLNAQMHRAWEQVNAGNSELAAGLFREAIGLVNAEFGDRALETARVYSDASTGLFLLGEQNYEESTSLLERALVIQTEVEGECNIGCARLHRQLGAMHSSRKSYEKAVVCFRKAIDIFEALDVFGSDVEAAEKSSLYQDLKTALLRADELKEEPEGLESATKRLHHCVESD